MSMCFVGGHIDSQKPEIRVLQVFSVLGIGGAETWLMSLLRYVNSSKCVLPYKVRIDVCLTGGVKGVFDDEAALLGAKLYYLKYSRRELLSFVRDFRAILSSGNYSAIHDHQDYTAGIHFLLGMGYLPPIRISHIHNPLIHLDSYYTSYLRRLTAKAGKLLLSKSATHILGTSRQIVSEYGFDEIKSSTLRRDVVHCGFDVDRFNGDHKKYHEEVCCEFRWNLSSKIILFVGRLNSNLNQKNPSFALDVVKACLIKDPSIKFLMVGDGEEAKKHLGDTVKAWGLQESIHIVGPRSDIPRLMLGSNLLLFPSVGEGLGMVAVEAQAAGLRVLASDAIPRECEVIPNMVSFKSLNDNPSDWADEALRLINLAQPDTLLCNGAIKNSLFSIEKSASRLLSIYLGLY